MKKNKTMKRIVAGCLLIGLLSAIGIGAYLTDTEVKEDVYTVGNVQAEIVANGDMEVANAGYLLPSTFHTYERAATNTGINDAYVFMSITIPYDYFTAQSIHGYYDQWLAQIFVPCTDDNTVGVNDEWKLVDAGYFGQYELVENYSQSAHEDRPYSAIIGNTITYVYGYVGDNTGGSLKALASGETTSNLLDKLYLINLSNITNVTGEVSTKLYAIQSNNVNGGLTDVNGVWAVINTALVGEIEAPELACQHVNIKDCVCTECGEEFHKSIDLILPAGDATCTMMGSDVDIYACYDCEHLFLNAEGIGAMTEEEIMAYEGLIMPTGHNIVNSEYGTYCTKCNYEGPDGDAADTYHPVNTETCICEDCGKTIHTFTGDDDNCIYCGVGHTHEMRFIPAREVSCRNSGYAFDAYKCTICEKLYTDENGENRVDREDWIIDRLDHNYVDGTCTICGGTDHGNGDENNGAPNVPETPVEPFDASRVEWRFFDTDWEKNTVLGGQTEGEEFVRASIQNLMMSGDTATFTVGYANYNDVDAVVTALIENSNPEYFSVELDNDIIIPARGEGVFTVTVTLIKTPTDYVSCELIINIEAVEAN